VNVVRNRDERAEGGAHNSGQTSEKQLTYCTKKNGVNRGSLRSGKVGKVLATDDPYLAFNSGTQQVEEVER